MKKFITTSILVCALVVGVSFGAPQAEAGAFGDWLRTLFGDSSNNVQMEARAGRALSSQSETPSVDFGVNPAVAADYCDGEIVDNYCNGDIYNQDVCNNNPDQCEDWEQFRNADVEDRVPNLVSTRSQQSSRINIERILRPGVRNNDVLRIQEALGEVGYYQKTPLGVYDSETTAAVSSFQRANGLVVDGKVGPNTVDAINDALDNFTDVDMSDLAPSHTSDRTSNTQGSSPLPDVETQVIPASNCDDVNSTAKVTATFTGFPESDFIPAGSEQQRLGHMEIHAWCDVEIEAIGVAQITEGADFLDNLTLYLFDPADESWTIMAQGDPDNAGHEVFASFSSFVVNAGETVTLDLGADIAENVSGMTGLQVLGYTAQSVVTGDMLSSAEKRIYPNVLSNLMVVH